MDSFEVPVIRPKENLIAEKKFRDLMDKYKSSFLHFSQDSTLKYKLANIGTCAFELETGNVLFGNKFLEDSSLSTEQIVWAGFHELSHYVDLRSDSEGCLNSFKYSREKAKSLYEKLVASGKNLKDFKYYEAGYAKYYSSGFFNVFDDIYVNNLVSSKAGSFKKKSKFSAEGSNLKEVKKLYQEKLFKNTDYSELPRHLQFVYKCLREEMIDEEECIVSEEIQDVFNTKIQHFGKEYSVKEIIDLIRDKNKKASERHKILKYTLEPIFDDLLFKDLMEKIDQNEEGQKQEKDEDKQESDDQEGEEGEFDESAEGDGDQEGEGNGDESDGKGSGEGKESDEKSKSKPKPGKGKSSGEKTDEEYPFEEYYENSPIDDRFSEEDIEEWIKKEKEKAEKEKAEKNKTAEQKAKENKAKMDQQFCEQNGVTQETYKKLQNTELEIEQYLDELSELWREIIYGLSKEYKKQDDGWYKIGTKLSIPKVIKDYPNIYSKKLDQVRIFEKSIFKEALTNKPKEIRIRMVGDMSGSMIDGVKLKTLQQVYVLLLRSLQNFNDYLDENREYVGTELMVNTECQVFGNDAETIKHFIDKEDKNRNEETIEIARIFENLTSPSGGTYDARAFEKIAESYDEEYIKKIESGEILEVVFEITDGASSTEDEMKKLLKNIKEKSSKIIFKSFFIGNDISGIPCFESIWGDDGLKLEDNMEELIPIMKKILEDIIKMSL